MAVPPARFAPSRSLPCLPSFRPRYGEHLDSSLTSSRQHPCFVPASGGSTSSSPSPVPGQHLPPTPEFAVVRRSCSLKALRRLSASHFGPATVVCVTPLVAVRRAPARPFIPGLDRLVFRIFRTSAGSSEATSLRCTKQDVLFTRILEQISFVAFPQAYLSHD